MEEISVKISEKRTRVMLRKTLFKLLKSKTFNDISVNEICNISMISRSTFYSYYADKYRLLSDTMENLIFETSAIDSDFKIEDMVESILSNIMNHKRVFYNINESSNIEEIITMYHESFRKRIIYFVENTTLKVREDIPIDVLCLICSSGIRELVNAWLYSSNHSNENLVEYLTVFLKANLIKNETIE